MPRARYSSLRLGQRGRITSLCRSQLQQLVRRRHYVRLRKGHHARHLGDVRLTVGKKCCRDHRRTGKDFCRRTENVTEILYGERARLPDFSESRVRTFSKKTFRQAPARRAVADFKNPQRRFQGDALTSRIEGIFYPEMPSLPKTETIKNRFRKSTTACGRPHAGGGGMRAIGKNFPRSP